MDYLTQDAAESHFHSTVFGFLRRTGAAGAAVCLVKTGGRAPFSLTRAYGYSSVDERLPATVGDTWFELGGLAHALAVLTTLLLIEEAGVDLDTEVNSVLPDGIQVDSHGWRSVTLAQLLAHTSGVSRGSTGSGAPRGGGSGGGGGPMPASDGGDASGASGGGDAGSPGSPSRPTTSTSAAGALRPNSHPQRRGGGDAGSPGSPSRPATSTGAAGTLRPNSHPQVLFDVPPPHARPGNGLKLEQRLMLPTGCRASVVHHFLSRYELGCDTEPGASYRPSEVDVMLLAAVAEKLGGGPHYPVLARARVLDPLGIPLGSPHDVSCYSVGSGTWRPAGVPQAEPGAAEALSPLGGLVLTADGAARLLAALLPPPEKGDKGGGGGADAPAASASAAGAGAAGGKRAKGNGGGGGEGGGGGVVSTALLLRLTEVHFVDGASQLPVGFLLSCPPLGRTSAGVFVLTSRPGDTPTGHEPSSSGAPAEAGCQAVMALVPGNGVGVLVMCNTADAGGHASSSTSFCQQVLAALLESFRPMTAPPLLTRPWLLNLPPVRPDALLHLLIFPPAGTSAPALADAWPAGLPDYVRVRAVVSPGSPGARATASPLLRVARLAEGAADAIAASTPRDAHIVLWGHGLGALVAFEAARRLTGWHQRPPLHVFVSGCAAPPCWPSNDRPEARYTPWSVDPDEARHIGLPPIFYNPIKATARRPPRGASGGGSAEDDDDGGGDDGGDDGDGVPEVEEMRMAHDLPDAKLHRLLTACRRTPGALRGDAEALRAGLGAMRAGIEAEETYVYAPPLARGAGSTEAVLAHLRSRSDNEAVLTTCRLDCPVTVLVGDADVTLVADGDVGSTGGWAQMTSGDVATTTLPGEHLYYEEERGRKELLKAVAGALGRQLTAHTAWLAVKQLRARAPVKNRH
ncbi:hypothetical protein FOA52_000898 [Chlamydomonas sp. UWO 241]|nr:hypothetical protein FOA52_000898 [Chlamydomonas sp. UWO 241]